MPPHAATLLALTLFIGAAAGPGSAQDSDLAGFFGFEPVEVIKIGRRGGPLVATDVDGDGLLDLVVVNNASSRIDLQYQRRNAAPGTVPPPPRINEFPEHWRFRHEQIAAARRVDAVVPWDYDADGLLDLVCAVGGKEIVFHRQSGPGVFEISRRHRVENLTASRDGLVIADLVGDAAPELVAITGANVNVWTMRGDALDPPRRLASGAVLAAVLVEDLDGDGRSDLAGIAPDDAAPVSIWFGAEQDGLGVLGPRLRHELPPLVEAETLRLPGVRAARLAVIERASRRLVVYQVAAEPIEERGDRDASISIFSFTDPDNRERRHAVVDVDGDGLLDLVATDAEANALVVFRQRAGVGLQPGVSHPTLTGLTELAARQVDDDAPAELFVLSEKESVIGRCDVRDGRVPFPRPVAITEGRTPTALNLVDLEDGPRLAVVAKDGRDYVLDLIDMSGATASTTLGKLSRSPDAILDIDADQDGRTDLLLFTREKPMKLLHAGDDGFRLIESRDMGQFGLVQAARADNTAVFDIDGDGRNELLIADSNFVRAVRYEPDPGPGFSPGWQVVAQINAARPSSRLVSLDVLGERIVAADPENNRLVIMAPAPGSGGTWEEVESLSVRGFTLQAIHAGAFSGDGREDILAVGAEGFAVIRLAGERVALKEVASWRSPDERRLPHELAAGDVNGDGFTDLVALDAGEQMCDVFTFTETGTMLHALAFRVFESRLFSGGEAREFEPRQGVIADVTGDGANDLVLLAHDRVLVYPQMTEAR